MFLIEYQNKSQSVAKRNHPCTQKRFANKETVAEVSGQV